jgi:type IV pilus assembly protein PilO
MNATRIINLFESLSLRAKLLGSGFLILLIVFIFYIFIYLSQQQHISNLTKELTELDGYAVSLKINGQKIKDIEQRIAELDDEITQTAAVLPDKSEIPELLKSIAGLGRLSGLEFLLFKPGGETKQEYVAETPVSIKIQGTFFQTASLFYKLSTLPRVVNVTNFTMGSATPMPDGSLVLTTELSAKTFRLLSEVERKQIEEEKKREEKQKKK